MDRKRSLIIIRFLWDKPSFQFSSRVITNKPVRVIVQWLLEYF
jgi:hypothetical protein